MNNWLASLSAFLDLVDGVVWGPPLVILLVGAGLFLTVRLGFVQFTQFFHALYLALIKRRETDDQPGDITHFQALMTALAATVGTGNIAGVALAIYWGGPGALFWMWITGLVGMATKYAEAVLAVEYRIQDARGRMRGGPMYYLSRGLTWGAIPAFLFAVFGAFASFGIGNMTQSNSVATALQASFGLAPEITAVGLTLCTGLVILGGIKSVARTAEIMVPIMILLYIGAGAIILVANLSALPGVFALIFKSAFSPPAVAGGGIAAFTTVVFQGVKRGIFSNESGLGSSPIAAAAAQTRHPVSQALVSMTQTFIDTLVVCTFTGLVIIVTGSWDDRLEGAAMTTQAFALGLGSGAGSGIVAISLALFAYSTLLGWSYYGERCVEYLLGDRAIVYYRIVFTALVAVGCLAKLELVWAFSDIMNGLMALPNLIGLIFLSGIVARITREYVAGKRD